MNKEELELVLNEMDEEERELVLAADDAYDRLYAYRLERDFGVKVVCNPDGDRTKIMIDGVVMNQFEFAEWLAKKTCGSTKKSSAKDERDHLPCEISLYDLDLDEDASEREIRKAIKNHTGYFVAKDCWTLSVQDGYVVGIDYGRKASPSELDY